MGMTLLHILCCIPNTTVEMIRIIKDASIMKIKTQNNDNDNDSEDKNHNNHEGDNCITMLSPLELFVISRNLLSTNINMDDSITLPSLHDILRLQKGVKYNDLECLLALQGGHWTDLDLCTRDESSGLLPFMVAAATQGCGLDSVYMLAMRYPHLI